MQQHSLSRYFRRRTIVALAVLLLCALVFVYAMQITTVTVLADEAMRARAQYAIGPDTSIQNDGYLARFFADDYLHSGELQALKAAYDGITISSYIQLASSSWVWTWPWGGSAYVKVHDKVSNIMGDVVDSAREDQTIPAWPSGLYALTLKRRQGIWRVDSVELIALDAAPTPTPAAPEPTPEPTPTMAP
jgi:hypothetical protein